MIGKSDLGGDDLPDERNPPADGPDGAASPGAGGQAAGSPRRSAGPQWPQWHWPRADAGTGLPEPVPGTLQEQTDAYGFSTARRDPGAEDLSRDLPGVDRHPAHPGAGGPARSAPPDRQRPVFASESDRDRPAHGSMEGTGNLKHVLQTGLPPGVDYDDVTDPGSKARATALRDRQPAPVAGQPPAQRH